MHYSQFSMENFRGISEPVTINLQQSRKKPICLVGNNESGKTTILKGIELIGLLCKGKNMENGELVKCRPKQGMDFTGDIALSAGINFETVDLKVISEDDEFSGIKKWIKKRDKKIEIRFVYCYEVSELKAKYTEVCKLSDAEDVKLDSEADVALFMKFISDLPSIVYLDDFNFDIPDFIRFPKPGYENSDDVVLNSRANQFWQEVFNDIFKGASVNKKTKRLPPTFQLFNPFMHYVIAWENSNAGDRDAVKQRIAGMSNFLNEVIQKDWEDISGLKSSFERFVVSHNSTAASNEFEDYTIAAYEKGNAFALSERSKGCRWFFCFKVLTQIRGYRDQKETIFLLDEPASNLHIHPQDKILLNLRKLARTKRVIYSTHAPHLIDIDNLENCLVVNNKKVREVDDAKIIVSAFDTAVKEKTMIQPLEPVMERLTVKAINPEQEAWNKVWNRLKESNTLAAIAERLLKLLSFY